MGLPERSPANSNSMQRVKVYRLNDDGKWDDQGTGHVTVDYLERSEELGLFVIDEEDNETLLLHRISSNDIYRKQEDTIISWRDPEYSTELALSFQETTGCSYIWDQICSVQRNLHFNTLNNETYHRVTSELRELPPVELTTLPLVLKTVVESGIADQMRLIELILNDQVFLGKLMELFHICEDLENIDGLHMIFKIVRGIINLNSPQIFERIFGDDLIMDIIGSLENDPDFPHAQHHRNFLKEHVVFKEAIPIKNVLALSKIHQTYRVSYLKDVVLARVLDESTVANLNSIIHANNAIVVSLLKDDNTFIQELFARLRSPTICLESKKNLVYFLHEFCSLSKSLQMVQQLRLFRDLMNEGIFEIITDVLQSEDKRLVLTGTDILIFFLNQDPNLLRSYVIRQEGISLFGLLVKGMITDFGGDMHCQFLEILRNLLDSYSISGAQRDTIIEIFYEQHFSHVIDIMTESCSSEGSLSMNKVESFGAKHGNKNAMKPEILSNICELLCFCVLHHPYQIKYCFLLNKVVDKVLLLTQRREKYLVVAAVRFVRTILSRHDEHLINHFVKNNLLKPIIEVFVVNGNRYNLLNSAVLDLLEYIRKENLKPLVIYIVDSFWNELVQFEYLGSIRSLKVKYEQWQETCGVRDTANISDTKNRIEERVLEKEEDDYFNGDSDEEDAASPSVSHKQKVQSHPVSSNGLAPSYPQPSTRSRGLVDYDDDEEDDDECYGPPQRKQPEATDEDEGMLQVIRLKRKLSPKNKEPDLKKHQLCKTSKSKDGVFSSLYSPLSQAVSPAKKNSGSSSVEENHQDKDPVVPKCSSNSSISSEEEGQREEESVSRGCSDLLHGSSDRQMGGEEHPLRTPKSSSEMTVNGS